MVLALLFGHVGVRQFNNDLRERTNLKCTSSYNEITRALPSDIACRCDSGDLEKDDDSLPEEARQGG